MVHRIGLGDVGIADLVRAQVFLEACHRIVGVHVDRVIDLHLQDQVRAAAKVEAQMNAVGDRRQQALARPVFRNPEDTEQEEDKDRYDDCQLRT